MLAVRCIATGRCIFGNAVFVHILIIFTPIEFPWSVAWSVKLLKSVLIACRSPIRSSQRSEGLHNRDLMSTASLLQKLVIPNGNHSFPVGFYHGCSWVAVEEGKAALSSTTIFANTTAIGPPRVVSSLCPWSSREETSHRCCPSWSFQQLRPVDYHL